MLLVAGALVGCGDDDDTATSTSTTTTTTTATTSTTATTPLDTDVIVFPDPMLDERFDDPVAAATAFAVALGFVAPVVGPLLEGDSRSGEVEVRPTAEGPVTTVLVRRLPPTEHWWVIGSATPAILVEEPAGLDVVTSPLHLRGSSTAFEATVSVELRQDGSSPPLLVGWVMGGSMGEMGPFDAELAYELPSAEAGTLVLSTSSMEDGRLWEASVVRVRFGATSACGGRPALPPPTAEQQRVEVFYTCGADDDGAVVAVARNVPRTAGVLRASLEALVAGPTEAERAAGLSSWFFDGTAGVVRSVDLDPDGRAVVDLAPELRTLIPNASASAGSQLLLEQLDATVFAHRAVRSVEYRLGGSCDDLFEWLQLSCEARAR